MDNLSIAEMRLVKPCDHRFVPSQWHNWKNIFNYKSETKTVITHVFCENCLEVRELK